jgi:protein-disulfide isomerase
MHSEKKTSQLLASLLGIALIVASASGSTWWFVRRTEQPRPDDGARRPGSTIPGWREISAGATPIYMGESAETLLVFSDYQCPGCRILEASLDSLWTDTGGHISVKIRHYPLNIHPLAVPAAVAVECAAKYGAAPSLHAKLFANADSLGFPRIDSLLQSAVGASNAHEARTCFESSATQERVEFDLKIARDLKLAGTPALITRGRVYYGGLGVDSLRSLLGIAR